MGTGIGKMKQYKQSEYMPENAKRCNVLMHYYGKQKPSAPDGSDDGLKEVYECWDFPKSTTTTIHVLPTWRDSAPFWEENWDSQSFDKTYPAQLGNAGISEETYRQILDPLNRILCSFYPFQQKDEMTKTGPEDTFYILELRKRLKQASVDYPETRWSIHVHKFASDLAGSLFTETVLHSLQIKLLNQVSIRQTKDVVTQDSNSVSTPTSDGLKLEDVSSSKDEVIPIGKEDGTAQAPSPKPNYGDDGLSM